MPSTEQRDFLARLAREAASAQSLPTTWRRDGGWLLASAGLPYVSLGFAVRRFWLIITNVDRKIASSETIIVSSPYGYDSTPSPIQPANQMMWRYTNVIEPAKRVIASASRFPNSSARSSASLTSAGLTGGGSLIGRSHARRRRAFVVCSVAIAMRERAPAAGRPDRRFT